jgi:cyclophilin family peptidyl-prolyl cis-trans isomerase
MTKYLNCAAAAATLMLAGLLSLPALAQNPQVWMQTDRGNIILELDQELAPGYVDNFLTYVNAGFYDGLVFHRVIDEFVIQSGGFDRELVRRPPTQPPVAGEADNGLSNQPGTIAMALAGNDPDSATSQFYINLTDNSRLDGTFTVFGNVVMGMNTAESIGALRTGITFPNVIPAVRFDDLPVSPPGIIRAVEVAPDAFPIMPLHSGSWFDAASPGTGFNVEVTNDASNGSGPLLLVYWYNFQPNELAWFFGIAPFDYGDSEVTLNLLSTEGMGNDFQLPPPQSEYLPVGTLTVRFENCSTGLFSYQLDSFGEGDIDVTRLTIPDQESCEGL